MQNNNQISYKFGEHKTVIFKIILSQLLYNINEMMLNIHSRLSFLSSFFVNDKSTGYGLTESVSKILRGKFHSEN